MTLTIEQIKQVADILIKDLDIDIEKLNGEIKLNEGAKLGIAVLFQRLHVEATMPGQTESTKSESVIPETVGMEESDSETTSST